MTRLRGYRVLCGAIGSLLLLAGFAMVLTAFRLLGPGQVIEGPMPLGPPGAYFLAFTGTGLVGWGGGLLGAMREPATHRTVGTFTALALVIAAFYRMAVWFMGDLSALGSLPRTEALLFLVVALAFVWLRPRRSATGAPALKEA